MGYARAPVTALPLFAVLRLVLRLDVGPEYDSNANRAEQIAGAQNADRPHDAALVRATARLGFQWEKGANVLRLSSTIGGKIFMSSAVLEQSVLVGQVALEDRLRVNRFMELGV